MSMTSNPPPHGRRLWLYFVTILVAALLTGGILTLLFNIWERQEEAKQHFVELTNLTERTVDPAEWGKNFPRQYDSYKRSVDLVRTKHGGSDAINKLEQVPLLKDMYAGYAFAIEFREERGHAFMLQDQMITERVKQRRQPGACLHCHASVMVAYQDLGGGDVMQGFKQMCAMPWDKAKAHVSHPVSCLDCHDPKSVQLRITRPAFLTGIGELAKSDDPLPHLPSIERWRKGGRARAYDVNAEATRQELRSLVCAQCHVEYYFEKDGNLLTYPWAKGLKAEQMEAYYDELGFTDWKHDITGAPLLKAQHPEFELWSQGIHARSGVSCADCHMPYKREGAIKVSDHHVRSPLLNINLACQTCHRYSEAELLARAEKIQDRTKDTLARAQSALADLMATIKGARDHGGDEKKVAAAQQLQRKSQWRADLVVSENSLGFHASAEVLRLLAESIDYSRQGQVKLLRRE
jgi:nitrite reductase (cytochrome c-552)